MYTHKPILWGLQMVSSLDTLKEMLFIKTGLEEESKW